MMEEAMDESMDENEADMVDNPEAEMAQIIGDDDAKDQDKGCKCGDNVNKALINSLAACSQTLSTIEECKVGKVSSITSNEQVVPCTCEETLTTHLVESVKGCTDAVETLTKCKKGGGEKVHDSCAQRYKNNPNLKSGTYKLTINGKEQSVYCHMGERCGIKSGWMRVGYYDGDKQSKCPNDKFISKKLKNHLLCKVKAGGTSCASVLLESYGVKYSQVCGTVKGYQAGFTLGFDSKADINSPYLTGVSITRSVSAPQKRIHIFSLVAGIAEKVTLQTHLNAYVCPCNDKGTQKPPKFVSSHYYCESGTDDISASDTILSSDPLWDKEKFQHEAKCVKPMMPWFLRSITSPVTSQLELRLCRINGYKADVYLERFDIYIR